MVSVTGLISSLILVASSRDVPFHQLQQIQCLHHGSTKANLCLHILFCPTVFAVAPHQGFMEDLVIAVIAEVFLMLSLV